MGRKHTAAEKKKISKSMTGSGNSQWKDGRRTDYRKKMGLKKGDKREVEHKDGDRWNNSKSNLKVVNKSEHSKRHKREKNFNGPGNTQRKWRRKALRK